MNWFNFGGDDTGSMEQAPAADIGTTGQGSDSQPAQQPSSTGTNATQTTPPADTKNNTSLFSEMWQDKDSEPNKAKETLDVTKQQEQQQQQQQQFTNYVTGIMKDALDTSALSTAMTNNDPEAMVRVIQDYGNRLVERVLVASYRASQAQADQAVERAFGRTREFQETERARSMLFDSMPELNTPEFAPVAEAVLTRLISRGATMKEASEKTREYFRNMSEKLSASKVRRNYAGNFGDSDEAKVRSGSVFDQYLS
jgi:hypothetical protein